MSRINCLTMYMAENKRLKLHSKHTLYLYPLRPAHLANSAEPTSLIEQPATETPITPKPDKT